jgi:hypothetical protein
MEFINLTPHPIVIRLEEGEVVIPMSGTIARCTVHDARILNPLVVTQDGITLEVPVIYRLTDTEVVLPEPQHDVILIVSQLVAQAAKRSDVVYPTNIIREDGQVVACSAFGAALPPQVQAER